MLANRGDPEERLLASRELGRANRTIQAIRSFYLANAILAGILLLILILGKAGPLALLVGAAVFLVTIAGMSQVRKQPFLWTLGIGAAWTILMGWYVAVGGDLKSIFFFLGLAWTLGCWLMLPSTRRVHELLRRNPDLWIARRMRGRPARR